MEPALLLLFAAQTFKLESTEGLVPQKIRLEAATHKGRRSVRASWVEGEGDSIALLKGVEFGDGTLEIDIASERGPGANETARGFAGLAFRVAGKNLECFYLRPTNGRAEDQVRRNHSAQYIAHPEFPWFRLRKEFPEKYESYVDLVPAEWTRVKIEVEGVKARLYVHGAPQPTLIVNDLKHGESKGGVALWTGEGTLAHFANLRITPRPAPARSPR